MTSIASQPSQPLFTDEELNKNYDLKKNLFDLVLSGDAVLFVGSGLSIPIGYPSWDRLLIRLEELAQKVNAQFSPDKNFRESSPLDYANVLKKVFEKEDEVSTYYNELSIIFSRQSQGACFREYHKKLIQLPFSLMMTTNYDPALSEALLKSIEEKKEPPRTDLCFAMNEETIPQLSNFLLSLHKNIKSAKKIAHLHGYHDRPKEIILTKQDYEKYYFKKEKEEDSPQITTHFLVLWALIATRRIVFFGFGMKDPYLLQLLEDVRKRLWRWDTPTHINIAAINQKNAEEVKSQAVSLKDRYGVSTYFYENLDNSHKQLEILISELHNNCFPPKPKESHLDEDVANSTIADGFVEKAQGSATGMMPKWITEMNRKMSTGIQNEDR